MTQIYCTVLSGQGDRTISVYEVVKDADWINYIWKNGPITDKMIDEWLNSEYSDESETVEDAKDCLIRNCDNINDRALASRINSTYYSIRSFVSACKEHDWDIQEEFEGYIY